MDDTLQLSFLCAHPSLTPPSAVALTLRAVGGLTIRQIAQACPVPEATMALGVPTPCPPRRGGGVPPRVRRDLATAARLYAEAAHTAPNLAERDYLTRQAARLNTRRSR